MPPLPLRSAFLAFLVAVILSYREVVADELGFMKEKFMSKPEMKSDIKPLCDKHMAEMEPLRVKANMGRSDLWTWPAFRCPRQGCDRSFYSGGYATTSDGSIDPGSGNFIGCEDGAMFIESVEGDRLIWRCSKVGCQRTRTTDRAFRPSDGETLRRAI